MGAQRACNRLACGFSGCLFLALSDAGVQEAAQDAITAHGCATCKDAAGIPSGNVGGYIGAFALLATTANDSRAAAIVCAMSSAECAAETKPASNWDGAR